MKTATSAKTSTYTGSKRRLKLLLFLIGLFMAWALYTMINQMERQDAVQVRYLSAVEKREAAEQEIADLQQKINRLGDPEYIQDIARKEYGMVKPGERPIQVVTPSE